MTGYAFPQLGDYDDPQNLAFHFGQEELANFVEFGLEFNVDYTNDEFDVSAGKVYVMREEDEGEASGEIRHQLLYGIYKDSENAISFETNSDINYIWIEPNLDEQDNPQIGVNDVDEPPSDNALKIGEIDASSGNDLKLNRVCPIREDLESHDHNGDDISPNGVDANTVSAEEGMHNAVYNSIDNIPEELQQEGIQVYTRDEGLVIWEDEG